MKMFVQWMRATKHDFIELDSADWPSLVRKAAPDPTRTPIFDARGDVIGFTGTTETIDDTAGWVYQIVVQGMPFSGDHIAVQDVGRTTVVTVWNNDVGDQPAGDFAAAVHILHPTVGEWTYPSGDGLVTHKGFFHEVTLYLAPDIRGRTTGRDIPQSSAGNATIKPYSEFVPPADACHGIWVLEPLNRALAAVDYPKWREWL